MNHRSIFGFSLVLATVFFALAASSPVLAGSSTCDQPGAFGALRLTNTPADSVGESVAFNGDGYVVVWYEFRNGNWDIFLSPLDANGVPVEASGPPCDCCSVGGGGLGCDCPDCEEILHSQRG